MAKLTAGDRVGYAGAFLRNIGAYAGTMPQRRGTYLGPYTAMPKTHGFVRWDDEPHLTDPDPEHAACVRANGSLVALSAIARQGSRAWVD